MIKKLTISVSKQFATLVQLSEKQYLTVAVKKIHQLTEIAEELEEKHNFDIVSTDQVLKVRFNNHSIVVNTQTPNRQLWYSCTKSGPQRFDYVQSDTKIFEWQNNKGEELAKQLVNDLNAIIH